MTRNAIFSYCLLILSLVLVPSPPAHAAELGEYDIKSGMLYNFTNFIEWPAEALDTPNTLNVCIAGNSSAGRSFSRLHGKPYKNRTIGVRQIKEPASAAGCNILFLYRSESYQLNAYVQTARKMSILTVSDIEDFASLGGMIGFYEQDGKVRFEINLASSQQSRIKINSQLLKLARIVTKVN